jgi:DnaK suppressor protein
MKHTSIHTERIKQKLQLRRQQIVESLRRLENETQALDTDSGQDIGDRSVLSISKESLFEQISQQRITLSMVEGALGRIADGSFGVCASCEDEISARRLEALPWTQYCLRCQEAREDVGGRGFLRQASLRTASLTREG